MKALSVLLTFLPFSLIAQENDSVYWKKGGSGTVTFSQVTLSDWSAGGENSISLAGGINLYGNYAKGKSTWDNSLDLAYGLLKQGDGPYLKSDDRLELNSKYGWRKDTTQKWLYAALMNFRTQMQPGYKIVNDSTKIKISDFLAPAYLTLALGIDFRPNQFLSFFIAPFTSKITIVNDQMLADAGAFGVEPATYDASGNKLSGGENMRYEFGGYFKMQYKQEIFTNTLFQTKLDLFSNYLQNPEAIDVNWETSLLVKLNKFIVMNFSTMLIYDQDVEVPVDRNGDGFKEGTGPRTQFKSVFGIGFSYKIDK